MVAEIARAIAGQAWSLVTAALAALVAARTKEKEPWLGKLGFAAAAAFVVLFVALAFLDSRTIYRSHTAAKTLADLRREGWKRSTEWWTDCGDIVKAQEAMDKAEAIRLKIIKILKAKVSEAEADYFDTPKAAEAFPYWTTLKYCPQNILINQFAHRLERLGEIIRRIKQRGGSQKTLA